MDQMTGTGHTKNVAVADSSTSSSAPAGATELPASIRSAENPHGTPLLPVVAGSPLGGDLDPVPGVPVQSPACRRTVERLKEVLPGHWAELVENGLRRREFDR